jgi:hypothetical protein
MAEAHVHYHEENFTKSSAAPYEPDARYSHCSLLVDAGKWITYGGYIKGGKRQYPELCPEFVEVFDVTVRRWKQQVISGASAPMLPTIGVATASIGHSIYYFGGSNGYGKWSSELYCLDTKTNRRSKLTPKNQRLSPMAKHRAVMITYGTLLVIYGGYGPLPAIRHPSIQYEEHQIYKGMCLTNELVCYDTRQSKSQVK